MFHSKEDKYTVLFANASTSIAVNLLVLSNSLLSIIGEIAYMVLKLAYFSSRMKLKSWLLVIHWFTLSFQEKRGQTIESAKNQTLCSTKNRGLFFD